MDAVANALKKAEDDVTEQILRCRDMVMGIFNKEVIVFDSGCGQYLGCGNLEGVDRIEKDDTAADE